MKKNIVPILAALIILAVLFAFIFYENPGFREQLKAIVKHVSSWLKIDWEPLRKWMSAGGQQGMLK
jgi:predicted PurR-regulated permease PerM